MYANVIPNVRTFHGEGAFSYEIPSEIENEIKIGQVVKIPYGKRSIRGLVVEITDQIEKGDFEIKKIISIYPDFLLSENYIRVIRWISSYYLCSLGEALDLFLPPEMKRPKVGMVNKELRIMDSNKLSVEQQAIFEKLKVNLGKNKKKPALIYGVTGSGKTEIYIKLVEEVLKENKQTIVLVPEIILTPQTVERFEKVFGDNIVIMHSHLSKSEKFNCYWDFYTNRKKILIGPRSALLVPSNNLGLIIVDEEQEDAFKQEQSPRYHAVDLAEKIAAETSALLVLGSATPRIESFYKSQTKEFDFFEIKGRFEKDEMPESVLIDLKNEIKGGNFSPISYRLQDEIKRTLENKKQVLLFLNRRGMATFISCRDCGEVITCPNCLIPLVYHVNQKSNILNCHHCDFKKEVPRVCPKCGSLRIKFFGAGIERIEQEIVKLFPTAKVKLIDSAIAKSKNDYLNFYNDFKSGAIDIAIGTQILAKGLDIEGIDLVGIISADTGLHMPHFRASEKVFQILNQVSGRSGRKHNRGLTIIQSYWPDSYPVLCAQDHNYFKFYEEEIKSREAFGYPPFGKIVRIVSENEREEIAQKEIFKVADELRKLDLKFIGPGPCFYSKLHNKFRYHIIIKLPHDDKTDFSDLAKKFQSLIWDADPVNLL